MALEVITLARKAPVADGIIGFHFSKPDGFEFRAGQTVDLTLPDPPEPNRRGSTRTFNLSSAPFEHHLVCTTRVRDSAFKQVLSGAPVGTEIALDGPRGSFTLPDDAERTLVFITGGIGVTPVRSIIRQVDHDSSPHRILLFFANKTPSAAPYLDELTEIAADNDSITVVPTMTQLTDGRPPWSGETGRISRAMLARYLDDLTEPVYYLSGPGRMVLDMRAELIAAGVADTDIRLEAFGGY